MYVELLYLSLLRSYGYFDFSRILHFRLKFSPRPAQEKGRGWLQGDDGGRVGKVGGHSSILTGFSSTEWAISSG